MASESKHLPDTSWKALYRLGSVAAVLYVVLAVLIPLVLVVSVDYDFELDGAALLEFIAEHRTWWITLQGLVLGPSVMLIFAFAALYVALRQLEKTIAAIAALIAISSQILFLAYFPVVTGLAYLSDQFVAAVSPERRAALVGGAEALAAMNNAYGPSDTMIALGVLLYSLVMLKGVFRRSVAYLGMAVFVAAVIGAALKPVVGAAYLWWWALFVPWIIAVAIKLHTLAAGAAFQQPLNRG